MIHDTRIRLLSNKPVRNRSFVLYWMQASHRTEYNHALEYATIRANRLGKPLVVYFGLTEDYLTANERHYYFMLEGLREVQSSLAKRGIRMVVLCESPEAGAIELSGEACLTVVDRGYLKTQREWVDHLAKDIECPLLQVETNVVVPVEVASQKMEYSAATLRPKINEKLYKYLVPLRNCRPDKISLNIDLGSLEIEDIEKSIAKMNIDHSVKRTEYYHGGTSEAKELLTAFLARKLAHYPELRNDPTRDYLSSMSPYLHFGHISPLYIALRVLKSRSAGKEAYLEELITKRELSMNFTFYNRYYDSFEGIPEWSRKTLEAHLKDRREYLYNLRELENAETHDPYWNAAQKEMVVKGKMHGYMRMYWGKKIIEWSHSPEEAFKIALHLNDKYEIDGRDPNGFTGVSWCFGRHDRPWNERKIFGNVRYMNANGLKRKFDADGYVAKIESEL